MRHWSAWERGDHRAAWVGLIVYFTKSSLSLLIVAVALGWLLT